MGAGGQTGIAPRVGCWACELGGHRLAALRGRRLGTKTDVKFLGVLSSSGGWRRVVTSGVIFW